MQHSHRYFQNAECEYFPCHTCADPAEFNCLFCFCPLYFLPKCGGDYTDAKGFKDCSSCCKPHGPGGYDHVMQRLKPEFAAMRSCRRSGS